jgi:hypothetical protein
LSSTDWEAGALVADVVRWAIAPASMVPNGQTLQQAKYVTTGGVVKFAVGASGSIVFTSAITTSLPAGTYHLRARIERDDPPGANQEPSLLGTNAQLRRRRLHGGGVEDMLKLSAAQGLPVLGGNGFYDVVTSPGVKLGAGMDVNGDYVYWVQLELQQAQPATSTTRNAVVGLQLISG